MISTEEASTADLGSGITVIGRGHSGTRAMSHTLSASGVYMGKPLNSTGDLVPAEPMYEACRVMAKHVQYLGNYSWDFSRLHSIPIDPEFKRLIGIFLRSVLLSDNPLRGWKIPETTLVYPWIVRMYPEIRYIYWIRDPRDCILVSHMTDDLSKFGIPFDRSSNRRLMRAISWKYQIDIFLATPRPRNLIEIRFEDFVLHQDQTLSRLKDFLGFPLEKIPVDPKSVGRWKSDKEIHTFDLFQSDAVKRYYPDIQKGIPSI